MSDLTVRLLLGAGGLLVVAIALFVARVVERRRAEILVDVSALEGEVVFFSDRSCLRCDAVRTLLEGEGVQYAEYVYEDDAEIHRAAGVVAVPLVVIRSGRVDESVVLAGVPSVRRLRRALGATA
jgi:glutaredoxin